MDRTLGSHGRGFYILNLRETTPVNAHLMAYLSNPLSRRVRTNNHVERTNRTIRFLEKVRYKWRRRRTLVRFIVLTRDRVWKGRPTSPSKETRRPVPTQSSKRTGEKEKQRRQAA
jgi:hypothetical protein